MSAATYLQPAMSQPTATTSSSRRPAHRPTTYSGSGNYQPTAGSTTSYHQSPIPPPPRTSSNKHQGGSANAALQPVSVTSNSNTGASRSQSVRVPVSERESSKSATRRDGDRRGASSTAAAPSSSERDAAGTRRRQEDQENGAAPATSIRQERLENARGERNGASQRKETRFGNYILGQTLGEGEFGKVKLGWRKDGGVQVAIKLIRRDTLAPHPNRLSKIYREISILRTLSHPNIVKLFEMIENERHIGIILEYASGGELFDYILTHRYLKDPPACRLFAQLVSGVGYLHKMGIVHRDLKLENLLLDRNRNIIITDFGFANVFDPLDDISDYEDRLDDPNVLKELEKGVGEDGRGRRGDLMATSCGSPCYAAPELVVSDGVYTGRKVDVWSCGVILYAMLAGYLPFDDDPANPEGDNINLLYKYIVSTPLTFPEYVTPHARDLLRRILVPDPRKRADLFEVARHSWLSPFANVVGLITSSTTTTQDIMTTTVTSDAQEQPVLTRSASVREPSTTTHVHASPQTNRQHENSPSSTTTKTSGDAKRNTVQVEYVQPKTQTKRERQPGEERGSSSKKERTPVLGESPTVSSSKGKDKEPERSPQQPASSTAVSKPVLEEPRATHKSSVAGVPRTQAVGADTGKLPSPATKHQQRATSYQGPTSSHGTTKITVGLPVIETPAVTTVPQTRPTMESRDQQPASYTSSTGLPVPQTANRPTTAETAKSAVSRSNSVRQTAFTGTGKSSGSMAAPQPGPKSSKVQQPNQKKPYTISNPIPQDPDSITMTMSSYAPANPRESGSDLPKGHKRANTVGGPSASAKVFERMFGSSDKNQGSQALQSRTSIDRPSGPNSVDPTPRQSLDQNGSRYEGSSKGKRRFSLIPSWAHKNGEQSSGHARKSTQVQNLEPPQTSYTANGSYTNVNAEPTSQSMQSLHQEPPQTAGANVPSASTTNVAGVAGRNRKFGDDGHIPGSSGSTSAARKVMDFFRKRAIGRSK